MDLRDLPSVDRLLADEVLAAAPRPLATTAARTAVEQARKTIQAGGEPGDLVEAARAELGRLVSPALRRVLNATGVIVHTNLGRAPLPPAALARAVDVGGSYSNLELDLASGSRGSRQDHVADALRRLTGAEAALVVNNNAAAVLLALAALADGREVVVSRGELVEIGDGFRIPDVLSRSGARMVEVGTTNRTRVVDYERAIGPDTALLLRVHQSNYRIVGFTESVPTRELAQISRRAGLWLVDDLGSGSLVELGDEPTASASLAAGADLVCFSGDKLLGGPQAGIIAGKREWIAKIEKDPLMRAFRLDKMTLAALEATLRIYLDEAAALRDVPVLRLLATPLDELRQRAEALATRLAALPGIAAATAREDIAFVGGGSLPDQQLPTWVIQVRPAALSDADFAQRLRTGEPAVLGRLRADQLLLDVRTVFPDQTDDLVQAIQAVIGHSCGLEGGAR